MEKVTHWYFVYINKEGKEKIFSYSDSREYTQLEALNKAKKKYTNCKIATKEDLNKLL